MKKRSFRGQVAPFYSVETRHIVRIESVRGCGGLSMRRSQIPMLIQVLEVLCRPSKKP